MTDTEFYEKHDQLLQEVFIPLARSYESVMNPAMALSINYDGSDQYPVNVFIKDLSGNISYLVFSEKMLPAIKDRFENAKMMTKDEYTDAEKIDMLVYSLADFMFYHSYIVKFDTFKFISFSNYDNVIIPEYNESIKRELELFKSVTGSYAKKLVYKKKNKQELDIPVLAYSVYSEGTMELQFNSSTAHIPEDLTRSGYTRIGLTEDEFLLKCMRYYLMGFMCREVLKRHCSIKFKFEGDNK